MNGLVRRSRLLALLVPARAEPRELEARDFAVRRADRAVDAFAAGLFGGRTGGPLRAEISNDVARGPTR